MGGLFQNCQKSIFMRTALAEMVHQQPPTPLATDNTLANILFNGTAKQKYLEINMIVYWVRDRIRINHFHIF